jgi:hypothetical protein
MIPAAILVCVLDVLGRSAGSLPPIELVAVGPTEVSRNAEAFVRLPLDRIYLITSTAAFRSARCENRRSLFKLASIIIHEEWHIRHGIADERGAYEAQLMTLMWLGAGPESAVYHWVRRSMVAVLERQNPSGRAPPRLDGMMAYGH